MADKKAIRVKPGVLPEVMEIKRPDFTKKAADIEKVEAERVLNQGENLQDTAEESVMAQSIEAQEAAAGDEDRLDESAISDVAKWYVAHTFSGYENKVKATLEKAIENRHLENQIFEVQVPMQDVVEIKNGVRKAVPKKMYPGYVLVNMIMNDETWYVVRNTRGVTGFVGPGSKPVPLSDAEMRPLGIHTGNIQVDFAEGDSVAIIAGVWKDTLGTVSKIDYNKQTATINVELFGRETPVEISFAEVRKTN
ncbi:transcription antitermination protein nusG [Lachnospiraceae bacterium NK3A20]|jgi:transcriptional antiterminator NusG|nr:transcription antitermination protein nusG [Lachnospiraceae bacterium NK3A20]